MDQAEMMQPVTSRVGMTGDTAAAPVSSTATPNKETLTTSTSCPTCGNSGHSAAAGSFVYAIGRIDARFPRISIEKEFAQATGRAATKGQTDRQALQSVLSDPANRYLVRQVCWVMSIQGLETYILVPANPTDYNLLVEALRARPSPRDLDLVIGVKGPVAPPEMCNGLMVPIVAFHQIYSFDRESLLKAIPYPKKSRTEEFGAAAEELFDRFMQLTDNAGATDDHRALNYLAVRYDAIYAQAAEAYSRNASLTAVDILPSPLSGIRKIVDVIFSYTNRNTDMIEKVFCSVDMTEEFPFLARKLSPYIDRR